MAIQNRRGRYQDFDPTKLVAGEWAVVQSGDPNSSDGQSIYMSFEDGKAKRMATYEDMQDNIDSATADIQEELTQDVSTAITNATAAASNASAQASAAQTATQNANSATQSATAAATRADAAATRADTVADRTEQNFAAIEETSTASKTYSAGDYLVYEGQLYQVTSQILQGNTLSVGTNIATTSVGDELSELNSKTLDWEYVGNVYWWSNTWTCPANGFIEVTLTSSQNATYWYWYISDSKEATSSGWSHRISGYGGQVTKSVVFFVKKGAVLGTSSMGSVSTAQVFYYKFI